MKKLILPIIAVVFGGVGAGGGYAVKSMGLLGGGAGEPHTDDSHNKEKDGHGGAKDAHGSEEGYDKTNAKQTEIFRFGQQFVVPIVKDETPRFLVILNLGLEIDPGKSVATATLESRLRDVMLGRLLELGADGALNKLLEDQEARRIAKAALLEAAQSVLEGGAVDVLIENIGIQPYA